MTDASALLAINTSPTPLPPPTASRWARTLELLASMRFAIALLSMIGIASIVGTVLRQGESWVNYVNKFGPFWAEVFQRLGLFSVYSTGWFLFILGVLVTSTSLCIARNTPKILQDLRTYKEYVRKEAWRAFAHRSEKTHAVPLQTAALHAEQQLAALGWKTKRKKDAQGTTIAARRGGAVHKIGYLATHSAIVLICLGGLMDGNLLIRALGWWGGKTPFTGSGVVQEIPAQHWLPSANPSYRGNVRVAEGQQSEVALLNQDNGVYLQPLPFTIELKKFIVDFYSTGMPKLFASEVMIHDHETGRTQAGRIEVNHPLAYRGVNIYQASFEDGGSKVTLQAQPMGTGGKTFEIHGEVGGSTPLARQGETGAVMEQMTLEYGALRVFNIENFGSENADNQTTVLGVRKALSSFDAYLGASNKGRGEKTLHNVGPSITYRLRDAAGQAREYQNYMQPVDMRDGSLPVFLLGMRENTADTFRYLRIPADPEDSMQTFWQLYRALQDDGLRAMAAAHFAQNHTRGTAPNQEQNQKNLERSASMLLAMFAGKTEGVKGQGIQALGDYLEKNIPANEREKASESFLTVLSGSLMELLRVAAPAAFAQKDTTWWQQFIAQSVLGISDAAFYPAPLTFMLKQFDHVQASVFQVTRSPGQALVYLGCALLMLGVFAMLYVRDRRIWVWLTPAAKSALSFDDPAVVTQVRLAYSCNRNTLESDREFDRLKALL